MRVLNSFLNNISRRQKVKSVVLLALTLVCSGCLLFNVKGQRVKSLSGNSTTPVTPDTLKIADPTIFYANGSYFLIGTSGDKTVTEGFKLYHSTDLINWHRVEKGANTDYLALDSSHSFGNKGFWAPQLLRLDTQGRDEQKSSAQMPAFLLAYTANEQIAVAHSSAISGPFIQKDGNDGFLPLFNDGFKHIDPFIFTDPVSKKTFIYYVKLDHGNNIYVSELKLNLKNSFAGQANAPFSVVLNTEKPCIKATEAWENTAHAEWPVTEGPTVIYHKGFYYLFYSANDFRNPDYAVGYATASSPTGPWVKASSGPVISKKNTGLPGSGHGDIFQDRSGAYYYVFHAHSSSAKVSPRKTYLIPFKFMDKAVSTKSSSSDSLTQPARVQMDYQHVRPLLLAH